MQFALSLLSGRLVLLGLLLRAWHHIAEARSTVAAYLVATALSSVLWAGSVLAGAALPHRSALLLVGGLALVGLALAARHAQPAYGDVREPSRRPRGSGSVSRPVRRVRGC